MTAWPLCATVWISVFRTSRLYRAAQWPEEMAATLKEFATSGLLNLVGGCCGTTPAHIKAIAEAVAGVPPRALPQAREQAA